MRAIAKNIDSHFGEVRSSLLGLLPDDPSGSAGLTRHEAVATCYPVRLEIQSHRTKEGETMTFTMKRFALALRRGRSRPLGRCSVTCEMLEGRQLLSTGMQPGELMQMMPAPMSGGWESRWFALAPAAESTGSGWGRE